MFRARDAKERRVRVTRRPGVLHLPLRGGSSAAAPDGCRLDANSATGAIMPPLDPLPDPVAYAAQLKDDELRAYRDIYGPDSREWIIAREELARREGPSGWRIAGIGAAGLCLVLLARCFLG